MISFCFYHFVFLIPSPKLELVAFNPQGYANKNLHCRNQYGINVIHSKQIGNDIFKNKYFLSFYFHLTCRRSS